MTNKNNTTCIKLNCGSYAPQQTFEQLMSSHQNMRDVMYRLRVTESRLPVQPSHSQHTCDERYFHHCRHCPAHSSQSLVSLYHSSHGCQSNLATVSTNMTNATFNTAVSAQHIAVNHLSAFNTADDHSILHSLCLSTHTFGSFSSGNCGWLRMTTQFHCQMLKYLVFVAASVDLHAINS